MSNPILVWDAAFIPADMPEADGFAFYLAGGNQEHAWSKADIDTARAKYNYALPIFVRSNSKTDDANPEVDANNATNEARDMGFTAGAIALDMETTVDSAYVIAWSNAVAKLGYVPVCYGSASTVRGNRGTYYWAAHYGDFPIPSWAVGIQYHEGTPEAEYDLSHFNATFAEANFYPKDANVTFEPPPDLSATPYGTFIDLGWGAPFEYHYQVREAKTGTVIVNEVTSALSLRVSGLSESTAYQWRISVTPHGEWSSWRSVTTVASDPAS